MAVKPDHGIDMAVTIAVRIKKMSLITALLITVVQLIACSNDSSALTKNKPVPGFRLQNMQGSSIDFPQQFTNRVVIISFWADWCPACYREMRDFETIFKQYEKQGLSILAINIKQDRKTANAFVDDLNISYEMLLDTNGDIAKNYAVTSLPAAFIITREGKLHTRILGETPPDVFDKVLKSLL